MRPNAGDEELNIWDQEMVYFPGTSALDAVIVLFTWIGKPS